jgi:hypothetical protein
MKVRINVSSCDNKHIVLERAGYSFLIDLNLLTTTGEYIPNGSSPRETNPNCFWNYWKIH